MTLSQQDQRIYEYLRQYDPHANGAPAPSYREIADYCRLSSINKVKASLVNLKDAGLIEWWPGYGRSMRVIGNGR